MPLTQRQRERRMRQVTGGDFVYADTHDGLVRCRVLSITHDSVCVAITASAAGYTRGQVAWFPHRTIYPRLRVYSRQGRTFVASGPLTFITDRGQSTVEVDGKEVTKA